MHFYLYGDHKIDNLPRRPQEIYVTDGADAHPDLARLMPPRRVHTVSTRGRFGAVKCGDAATV